MTFRPRSVLLCAVTVCLSTASPAVARIRPGIEVGMNVSTINYNEELPFWDNGWRPSFTGGVVVEFPVGGRFALTTGLRYIQQGNEFEISVPNPFNLNGVSRIKQDYLAVPALLEFRPISGSGFFLSLGPEVGFLLSGRAESEYSLGSPPTTFKESEDIASSLEDVNVTIDGGAGVSFPFAGHVGIVQLRYTHGITSAAKKDNWFSDWTTRGIEFLGGMRW